MDGLWVALFTYEYVMMISRAHKWLCSAIGFSVASAVVEFLDRTVIWPVKVMVFPAFYCDGLNICSCANLLVLTRRGS